jgi:hypothetical protein
MERLKKLAGENITYLEPGTVTVTPGAVGVRTYVLGPPRDEDRLFHDLPTKGPGKETYLAARALTEEAMIHFAAPDNAEDPEAELHRKSPFARPHWSLGASRVEKGAADVAAAVGETAAITWFRDHYFAEVGPCRYGDSPPAGHQCRGDPLCHQRQKHRRIDADWLGAAGSVALKLDSDTNNTSLVLAFELPQGGVLLFAADAQVGNWLSWHDQTYGEEKLTAADILGRTILYKVGHHGSHNATLDEKGLRGMTDERLAAMIPVVEKIALEQGSKGWKMPFPELKEELLAKTSGRVLRGDSAKGTEPDGTVINSDDEFLGRVTEGPDETRHLWVELQVA